MVWQSGSLLSSSVTSEMVKSIEGGAAVNQLYETFDADLRVYELGLEQPLRFHKKYQ